MSEKHRHRLCKIGSSYAVFIPIGWVRFNDLEQGDFVEIISNGYVKITPLKKEEKNEIEG
jgi:hypothetical protein